MIYLIFITSIPKTLNEYLFDIFPCEEVNNMYVEIDNLNEQLDKLAKDDRFIFLNFIWFYKDKYKSMISKISEISDIYIYNFDQIYGKRYELLQRIYQDLGNICVNDIYFLDYSYGNDCYYDKINIKYKIILPKPIKNYEYPKINNVVFIGTLYKRRINILKKIKGVKIITELQRKCNKLLLKKISKSSLLNGYTEESKKLLYGSKILVNIHACSEYKIYETLRCDPCMHNKVIIISERSNDEMKNPYYHNIIFTEYKNIPHMVNVVLKNYEYYYNNLYGNFKLVDTDYSTSTLLDYNIDYQVNHKNLT